MIEKELKELKDCLGEKFVVTITFNGKEALVYFILIDVFEHSVVLKQDDRREGSCIVVAEEDFKRDFTVVNQ